ncbi:MAG TPA: DNA-binding domain-containing protein, partial [Blastocatellia bacterium]|nr:DNA-binding domain-containing protein [Blastocatellia bacterium]
MSNCVPTDSRLRELQQWMQAVITNQDRTSAHLLASEAVRTDGLAAAERLAIYSRSYQVRLLQCFQAIFPALRHALGDDIFARFVCDFLSYHPPTSYSLNQIADAFPQHLSE